MPTFAARLVPREDQRSRGEATNDLAVTVRGPNVPSGKRITPLQSLRHPCSELLATT
jgi:hypothetical protein